MFRPFPAIIRFSFQRTLVFIRYMRLCNDAEISSSVVWLLLVLRDVMGRGVVCYVGVVLTGVQCWVFYNVGIVLTGVQCWVFYNVGVVLTGVQCWVFCNVGIVLTGGAMLVVL